jgi:hypothetical protein
VQNFRKGEEPDLFALKYDGRGDRTGHFTAEIPVRKVETEKREGRRAQGQRLIAAYRTFPPVGPIYRQPVLLAEFSGQI